VNSPLVVELISSFMVENISLNNGLSVAVNVSNVSNGFVGVDASIPAVVIIIGFVVACISDDVVINSVVSNGSPIVVKKASSAVDNSLYSVVVISPNSLVDVKNSFVVVIKLFVICIPLNVVFGVVLGGLVNKNVVNGVTS
jgi:hypothetical protein